MTYMPIEVLRAQRLFKENAFERINMANISKVAQAPEASVIYVLKQIVSAVENTCEQGYTVKLNLRIG